MPEKEKMVLIVTKTSEGIELEKFGINLSSELRTHIIGELYKELKASEYVK